MSRLWGQLHPTLRRPAEMSALTVQGICPDNCGDDHLELDRPTANLGSGGTCRWASRRRGNADYRELRSAEPLVARGEVSLAPLAARKAATGRLAVHRRAPTYRPMAAPTVAVIRTVAALATTTEVRPYTPSRHAIRPVSSADLESSRSLTRSAVASGWAATFATRRRKP
jgi:hypothetical protein